MRELNLIQIFVFEQKLDLERLQAELKRTDDPLNKAMIARRIESREYAIGALLQFINKLYDYKSTINQLTMKDLDLD